MSQDPDMLNVSYLENLYQEWKKNPHDFSSEWNDYFLNLNHTSLKEPSKKLKSQEDLDQDALRIYKQSRVDSLVWAFRDIGYIYADLNPLGKYMTPEMRYMYITMQGKFQSLEPEEFGLSQEDMDQFFHWGREPDSPLIRLKDTLGKMRKIYCSHMGVELLHIQNKPMRNWLIRTIERTEREWPKEAKIRVLEDLIKAEEFEKFLHSHFIGQKRFSLEGSESLVPALNYLIRASLHHNIQEIVLGMTHRGRLNIFTNVIGKPASETFSMFMDNYKPHDFGGSGDVKYHLGQSFDYRDPESNSVIHISLVPNPSHLESVDPVVQGKARGVQTRRGDLNRKKVLPVLIHGDAAFSGQGVVSETFNLSQLKGYRTGGSVHIIVNNQIGFTTASRDARSTYFAADIAKTIPAPIFHVNGDDPEAVIQTVDFALRWRQKFGYDVVVDIFCYRRLGHNETDEPSFTHPIMYRLIKDHPSTRTIYGEKLIQEGIYSKEEQDRFKNQYLSALEEEIKKAKNQKAANYNDAYKSGVWKNFRSKYTFDIPETRIDRKALIDLGNRLTEVPENFSLHPKLKRLIKARKKMMEEGTGIDWSFGEALGFATLLLEGYSVRLSGEDCARGTFSQRHAQWWHADSSVPKSFIPFNHLAKDQGRFSVYDSPLSEYAVLGFEYGYSLSEPNTLVIWEAQFGDFANGAQVIIDQFMAAGEFKWFRSSGLTLLLPHGYEGQGPDHSSAHLERYLQLCAEENIQVCYPTTPAQYFHLLRKQMKQPFRKPLVVMTPKSLLRHKQAVSSLKDFEEGRFEMVMEDPRPPEKAEKIILCSGKIFYDLFNQREERGIKDTRIVRLEHIYPFPGERLMNAIQQPSEPKKFLWVQEESENRGAWNFVRTRLEQELGLGFKYVGRKASASPATGSYKEHEEELKEILNEALS